MAETMTTEQLERTVPNKAFDMEYQTMWKREMLYLKDHGFMYTFVKHTRDYNIPVYKYKKTPELFICLSEFYDMVITEKTAQ